MPEIAPFRGLLYNPERIEDLSRVLAPPYDVVSADRRKQLFEQHPQNIARIDLGVYPGAEDSRDYDGVADDFKRWIMDGILVRDPEPAIYILTQQFRAPDGSALTRKAAIALLRLETPGRSILPHERTHSGPKSDRMRLAKACSAQLSQVLSMAFDSGGRLDSAILAARQGEPARVATDPDGNAVALWRCTDPERIAQLQQSVADDRLLIADGHHRYETALSIRDTRRREIFAPVDAPPGPHDYVMTCLCSMADPGLLILPQHRMFKLPGVQDPASVRQRIQDYFDAHELPRDTGAIRRGLAEAYPRHACVLVGHGWGQALLCVLRDGSADQLPGMAHLQPPADKLDIEIVQRALLSGCLQVSPEAQILGESVDYTPRPIEVIDSVAQGKWDLGVIVNPPPLDQVRALAEAGGVMPQKSTYFYPKLPTGLVMQLVVPTEETF